MYCVNSPVLYCDSNGQSAELTLAWSGGMWWLAGADAMLPVGDLIYVAGIGACSIVDLINTIGIDNIATFFYNAEAGISNAINWLSNQTHNASEWINNTFGGGSSSPGGPNWNHRDYYLRNVKNKELQNAIKQLYRKSATIGDGGTADMLRHEFNSGQPLRHLQKAKNMITHLERILTNQVLDEGERRVAYQLLNDLYSAVKYVS